MTTRNWKFQVNGLGHVLEVRHGYWLGTQDVRLDGRVIRRERHFYDPGWAQALDFPGHQAEVRAITNGFTYTYILVLDGLPYPAEEDLNHPSELLKAALAEQREWASLGEALGLKYLPILGARGLWRHRLVGWWRGYPALIRSAISEKTRRSQVYGVLRYAAPLDLASFKQRVDAEPAFARSRDRSAKVLPTYAPGRVEILWPHLSPKLPAAKLAQLIMGDFAAIARHAGTLAPEVCDTVNCPGHGQQPAQLVLFNHFPLRLCPTCQASLASVGQHNRVAYRESPARLIRGLLVGLAVAGIGAIVFAAVTLASKTIAAVFAAAIFTFVVKAMSKVGTKTSGLSLLLAAAISMLGVALAAYLVVIWLALRAAPGPLDPDRLAFVLQMAWRAMLANPELPVQMLLFGLIGVGAYLASTWIGLRAELDSQFRPVIEIIGSLEPLSGYRVVPGAR